MRTDDRPADADPGRSSRPRLTFALVGGLALYPVLLVLIATSSGPGVSPDSVMYVSAARTLAASGELIGYTGEPLTIFPPGLPVVLAGLALPGIEVPIAAVILNLTCVALMVVLSYALAREVLRSQPWALAVAAVVSVLPATVRVFSMVWTEPLFVVLTLAALLVLTRAVRRRTHLEWQLVAAGLLVSAATAVRFIGFTLIPVVFVAAWLASRPAGRVRAFVVAAVSAAVASLGLIAVAARNLSLGSPPLGERYPTGVSIPAVLRRSVAALGEYVVPVQAGQIPALAAGLVVLVLLGLGVVRVVRYRPPELVVLTLFTALYWLSLWYGQISTQIDPVNERLLAPALVPMLIIVGYGLAPLFDDHRLPQAVRVVAATLAVLVALSWLAIGVRYATATADVGRGFNNQATRTSPLAAAVVALPADAGLAASNPALAYWTTQREPVAAIPFRGHYSVPAQTQQTLDELEVLVDQGSVDYLAYFDNTTGVPLSPVELASAGIATDLVATYPDGRLYRVR